MDEGSINRQAILDAEHLRLLKIFHYIFAAITALFSLFPLIHLVMGLSMVFGASAWCHGPRGCPPPFIGWIFVAFAGAFILLGEALAVGMYLNGRFMARRQHYIFCLIWSGIECLLMPYGTVLGVFSLLVLLRETVKAEFSSLQTPLSPNAQTP